MQAYNSCFLHPFHSKRHHCSVHQGQVAHMTGPKSEWKLPESEYTISFLRNASSALQPRRRSMKVPSQFLPTLPSEKMESRTMYHCDYIPQPPFQRPKAFKPEERHHVSDAKLMDETSYGEDFPRRPLRATYPSASLMHTSMPTIQDKTDDFETSNQQLYESWSGFHRPYGYCEPLQSPMFQGKFNGMTVTMRDYPQKALGRPRTCYKRKDEGVGSDVKMDGITNIGQFLKLPEIGMRDFPKLQNHRKKNVETKAATYGKVEHVIQYQRDNPPSLAPCPKRGMCLPRPENLGVSNYGRMDLSTSQKESYSRKEKQPPLEKSLKKEEQYNRSEAPTENITHNRLSFKPVSKELQVQIGEAVECQAAESAWEQRDGKRMKQIHNFGGKLYGNTVNHSDYFQFSSTSPRVRHGDKSERKFKPSKTKFVGVSESHGIFVPQNGEPAKLIKPLDEQNSEHQARREEPFTAMTTYHEFFPIRNLPKQEICLVEQMLQA